jgi:hypothetical protein
MQSGRENVRSSLKPYDLLCKSHNKSTKGLKATKQFCKTNIPNPRTLFFASAMINSRSVFEGAIPFTKA